MNDFGVDLTGRTAVFKSAGYYKKNTRAATRTVVVESGPGTSAAEGTGRRIVVRWPDGTRDTVTSYDLEYVIDGKKRLLPLEPPPVEVDVAPERTKVV